MSKAAEQPNLAWLYPQGESPKELRNGLNMHARQLEFHEIRMRELQETTTLIRENLRLLNDHVSDSHLAVAEGKSRNTRLGVWLTFLATVLAAAIGAGAAIATQVVSSKPPAAQH